MLGRPPPEYSTRLGVEEFLTRRARANSKPISGLESLRERRYYFKNRPIVKVRRFCCSCSFMQVSGIRTSATKCSNAWRRGDAESLARLTRTSFRDLPAAGERLISARNRNWIPKLERFIHSGQIYFVVVGAGHMGGPEGVIALLKARGYRIEEL